MSQAPQVVTVAKFDSQPLVSASLVVVSVVEASGELQLRIVPVQAYAQLRPVQALLAPVRSGQGWLQSPQWLTSVAVSTQENPPAAFVQQSFVAGVSEQTVPPQLHLPPSQLLRSSHWPHASGCAGSTPHCASVEVTAPSGTHGPNTPESPHSLWPSRQAASESGAAHEYEKPDVQVVT